jgi:outer membrane protein OmpA-like peptidoglycan-associated protein
MGFDHNRQKGHGTQDSMWTSYSDLFLGLSIIFLLLYVTASLKQGTDGIRQQILNQKLSKEADDLRQQIKVYETLKQDYLKQQASASEQGSYEELMDKLSLLQDQAKDEKNKLIDQAKENEKKGMALNKYQQMIRNIINSNLIAKARIKSRDTLIDTRDEEITEKTGEISELEETVAQKQVEVKAGVQKIEAMKSQLATRINQLRNSYKAHSMSKEKFEQQQATIKREADARIGALRAVQARTKEELEQATQELVETSSKLNTAEGNVAKLGQEKERLAGELATVDARHQDDLNKIKGDFENQRGKDRSAFDAQLTKEKLSGAQRAAREAQFKADAERKAGELAGKIADLDKKYRDSQGALAKATENLNARKRIAEQIKNNFAKQGVRAEVDGGTGDVMLSFGDQYFESGQAQLKPKMRQILEQAMPAYSSSLFENDKIASKIQSVEIVGFASPTYKGKFVDPKSLDIENRQAVNYNLDLSYNRARSIFNYVFDKEKMKFKHQERLLPLVKVTGRSFLANDKVRDPAAAGGTESFCRVNDCSKLQRVIIKFTLKD